MSIESLFEEAKNAPHSEKMRLAGIAETAEQIKNNYSHDTLCIELARVIRNNYKPVDCGHVMRDDGQLLTTHEALENVLFGMCF